MLGPNAMCSRLFWALLILIVSYFTYMNYLLYIRVRDYPVRQDPNTTSTSPQYPSSITCNINPICDVTVKSMMLDNANHYLLGPLAAIADRVLKISNTSWISPNMISAFHVLVAVAAAKCVSSDSLSQRRFGVVLFMIRTWLDDLDGHVARKRKNIRGEFSEVGTLGYWVDGICDSLGVTSLILGVYFYMRNNPPRRGYEKLLPIGETKEFGVGTIYKKKYLSGREVPKTLLLFVGQLLISSAGWNRYIALYQDLLETDDQAWTRTPSIAPTIFPQEYLQLMVFRSASFWAVTLSWTIVNIHTLTDYFLLAIFTDRLWEYLCSIRYLGYIFLFVVIGATEFHYSKVYQQFFIAAMSSSSIDHRRKSSMFHVDDSTLT